MKGTKSNAPAGERRTNKRLNKRLLLDVGFVRSDDELAETTCEIVPTDAGVEATLGDADVEMGLNGDSSVVDGDGSKKVVELGSTVASSEESSSSDEDSGGEESPPNESCCTGQWRKMKTTSDWWSLWIGLASFGMGEYATMPELSF